MNKSATGNHYHYLTILLFSALISMSPAASLAQGYLKAEIRNTNCPVASHEADRWYFGQNASLDFRQNIPEPDNSNSIMDVYTSSAIMADSTGEILFYTDGTRVWDRTNSLMPNGSGLHSAGSTMPVIIIPKPESDSVYYIFTTSRPKSRPDDPLPIYGLEYNIVNLNMNNGRGDVALKNKVLLQPDIACRLTAVKHSNGVDYWVVGHRYDSVDVNKSREFCAFKVTKNGVDSNYVSSKVGTEQGGFMNSVSIGYMKISPDGSKLASAIHGLGIYEICNFDASSGKVSNAIPSSPVFMDAYGIEFSPDSRFLYATTTSGNPPTGIEIPESYLFQFDISNGNSIFNLVDTIAVDTLGSYFTGMQLGTDGKIYVSRYPYGNAALSVIRNPKRPGQACNFTVNDMDLQGKRSRNGLPNFIQSYFDLPHFDVENVCYNDSTIFTLQNNSNVDNISWKFGDPDSNPNASSDIQAGHVFSGPGSYTVEVTETFDGKDYGPYTETVVVNELPFVDIGDTVYMYPGAPKLLDAGEGYDSYEWSTGETKQVVKIKEIGTYWVTVQNEKCCFNTDTTVVIYFDIIVPNAFRPDGKNSIFKAYASSLEAINNFTLYIYNRWGQQIFSINDITQGWDGTIDGIEAPGDVYVWLVNYDIERSGKTERVAYKGNVILLR